MAITIHGVMPNEKNTLCGNDFISNLLTGGLQAVPIKAIYMPLINCNACNLMILHYKSLGLITEENEPYI